MKKNLLFLIFVCNIILISWCTKQESETTIKTNWPANPASVYCEENWWTLEIIKNNEWEFGMCKFDDGSECEERDFYNKECFPINE